MHIEKKSRTRKAHDVDMRLKESEKNFSGDIGDCWMDFLDEYKKVAMDYKLNQQQMLQFIQNNVQG